jgi:hypothetical protein
MVTPKNGERPAIMQYVMLTLFAMGLAAPVANAATKTIPAWPKSALGMFSSCKTLNLQFPNGVGRASGRDVTEGPEVTNFEVNETLYWQLFAKPVLAKSAARNGGKLDRDKDGIACERVGSEATTEAASAPGNALVGITDSDPSITTTTLPPSAPATVVSNPLPAPVPSTTSPATPGTNPAPAVTAPAPPSTTVVATSVPGAPVPSGARRFARCDDLHAVYPHGVARTGATDSSSSNKPVVTFAVDDVVYNANTHLDRDGDGVACENA